MKPKIVFLSLLALVHSAFACDCITTTAEQRRDLSSVVFVGRVVGLREEKDARHYEFEVTEVMNLNGAVQTDHRLHRYHGYR